MRRRKFRSQTSDKMDRWKSRGGKSQRREEQKREDQRREKVRRKKMQAREKVGKSRNTVFLPMVCCSGGSKSRMRDEKLHAVVARSTFGSQNVQNSPGSDHFWKLRCRKSARRCGGPLLEVEMMKKCTALWREAHFEVKMCKTPQLRSTFGS